MFEVGAELDQPHLDGRSPLARLIQFFPCRLHGGFGRGDLFRGLRDPAAKCFRFFRKRSVLFGAGVDHAAAFDVVREQTIRLGLSMPGLRGRLVTAAVMFVEGPAQPFEGFARGFAALFEPGQLGAETYLLLGQPDEVGASGLNPFGKIGQSFLGSLTARLELLDGPLLLLPLLGRFGVAVA